MTYDKAYDIAKIRHLLLNAFTAEDLRRFCMDRPTFRPICNRFGPGHGLDDMVDEVIDYCRTQLLFDELLAEVRRVSSGWYNRLFGPEPSAAAPARPGDERRPEVASRRPAFEGDVAPQAAAPPLSGFDQPVAGALLEIIIQHRTQEGCPVVAELAQPGQLPRRAEGLLQPEEGWQARLLEADLDARAYGTLLGQALFRDHVRDALVQARGGSQERLRVLLVVEDAALRSLHWERLCGPIGPAGRWSLLALDQRLLFSLYLPALSDRAFPDIGRRDLRALVLVADPPPGNRYKLDPFDAGETVASIRAALGDVPHHVLANVAGAQGRPTLDELVTWLTNEPYTLLHVVAHGLFRSADGETVIYLLDDEGQVKPTTATRLIERLDQVHGPAGLPRLIFLATCESADPRAEAAGALGGLAQRLVREVGIPAVVAMTQKVSLDTAGELAGGFYRRLRAHGEVDRALVEAAAPLASAGDVIVAALYNRLGGRPLFSGTADWEPTPDEIDFGLDELERLLPERAPVLLPGFRQQAGRLWALLGTPREDLSPAARREWDGAEEEIKALCEEVLDLSFQTLARGQSPPAYDARCPFRGMHPFRAEDREFFFGRAALVGRLAGRLAEHNCLAVLGPSGCGKSSVVLAGLVPALQAAEPGLQMAYLTPGEDPVARLEAALSRVAGQPALVVADQFEELFTLCNDEGQRREFLEWLLALVAEMRVVITMRADFWGECARYRELRDLMQARQELIGPMDEAEQRRAMEMQAGAVLLRFEADLAHTLLDDVRGEPGAMPLLQHALLELWNRRHGSWLRASEYRAIGKVQQAIAHTADGVYAGLSPGERQEVRDLFLRLTRLGDVAAAGQERRDTGRRAALAELVPAGGDLDRTKALVARLADARLVVTQVSEMTGWEEVAVAHEALIQYWPRLRVWLDRDQAALRALDGIRRAAGEWQQNDEDESYILHRGRRLARVTALLGESTVALNSLERTYLDACLALSGAGQNSVYVIGARQPARLAFEPELVRVPAGPFLMGTSEEQIADMVARFAWAADFKKRGLFEREQPQHEVVLPAFEIARTLVTNAQYAAFVEATGHDPPRVWTGGRMPEEVALHPVVSVTWDDARAYAAWLRQQSSRPYRLPTEAEWEKAARGEDGRLWPWGNDWDPARANCAPGGPGTTTPVGHYSPQGDSSYGCADMAGNVWEWTGTLWGRSSKPDFQYPYKAEDGRENLQAGDDVRRVLRGGSFVNNQRNVRCAFRYWRDPNYGLNVVGFRVVVAPGPSDL